jgi:hypothetical protein
LSVAGTGGCSDRCRRYTCCRYTCSGAWRGWGDTITTHARTYKHTKIKSDLHLYMFPWKHHRGMAEPWKTDPVLAPDWGGGELGLWLEAYWNNNCISNKGKEDWLLLY